MDIGPIISVMIPTYEPGELLLLTLRSVLDQLDHPERFQVAIVDDASPTVDVEALIAPLRQQYSIEVYRHTTNLRLADNWNRAISLARGELIHLLHQDDLVLPGFYAHMRQAFTVHPDIGMAFCRHAFINEQGEIEKISRKERLTAGILPNWPRRISKRTRMQCPAVMVRKSVYVQLGGYRNDLIYALDWEMWVRIALHYPVWFEPARLASYRRHLGSESERLAAELQGLDLIRAIDSFRVTLASCGKERYAAASYLRVGRTSLKRANKALRAGKNSEAIAALDLASCALTKAMAMQLTLLGRQRLVVLHHQLRHYREQASLS